MAARTLVASATNLLVRGFQFVPVDRLSPQGEPVNALYAVARALQHALGPKVPARAVAILEVDPPVAGWPPQLCQQLPRLPELLHAIGLHVVHGTHEPHLVASYVQAALDLGDDVMVVGSDKRFAQLVSDRVWWYDAFKDARYTPEMVRKRFTVDPAQVAEWLALVGDDDALPGVSGIGAKTATGLLEQFGSIERAMAAAESVEGRPGKALRAAAGAIPDELKRARLERHRPLPAPLEDLKLSPTSGARNQLYEQLGFVELLTSEGTPATRTAVCTSQEDLLQGLRRLGDGPVTLHALLEDPEPGAQPIAGVALTAGSGSLYIPLAGAGPHLALSALKFWLEDAARLKLGHDLVGTVVGLRQAGITLAGISGDSACASHLTEPSNWAQHDLPIVAKHALGRALPDEEELRGVGAQRKRWAEVAVERAADFAGRYAEASTDAWRKLSPHVAPELMREYLELSDTLVRMELTGMLIDAPELTRAEQDFAAIETDLQKEVEALAGRPFNINSSKQLGTVLFEELKLPVVSHTKTGWSTANEALERIEHAHPIVRLVLRWRLLRRLRDSWIISLRECIAPDGRVHSRFYPARSFSGRLVNTRPDLARVPRRGPEMSRIRRAFVAPEGSVLVSIDYNQLGLHVLAHLTQDPALLEPLRDGDDVHALTAAAVLDRPRAALTPEDRELGKLVNFATFAGQGPSALALQLGIPAQDAKVLIERFDRHYAKVRAFQDEQFRLAQQRGYIETLATRHWPIGGLASLDPQIRSYAERLARRATHEGSVADVCRRGLLEADRALRAAGLRAAPLAQIVDEILFEVPKTELPLAVRVAADAMRNAFPLEVPLKVGAEAGPNWAELEPFDLSAR